MKYLTLDMIKRQLRIDGNQENTYLEWIGEVAEDIILMILERSFENVVETFGGVPRPVKHATLLLADHLYQYRGIVSPVSLSDVPYTYNLMLMDYIDMANSSKIYRTKGQS